jgi:hypothetical protein
VIVLPGKGARPVSISYATAPRENTSARASTRSPIICSGAMYRTEPTTVPATVRVDDSSRATPKSITFTPPSSIIMMFAGLMSRWMMPCLCA